MTRSRSSRGGTAPRRYPSPSTGPHPLLVGLTGGFGCGKSSVAAIIRERYPVLDSDVIAQELISSRQELQRSIREAFGPGVFSVSGELDRPALAQIVFRDDRALGVLNAIVHPPTLDEIAQRAAALGREGHAAVFVESALIYEAGLEHLFDYVVVVTASERTVIERAQRTGRYSADDIRARISRQLPIAEKGARADFTISNDGSIDDLRQAVSLLLTLVPTLCSMPQH